MDADMDADLDTEIEARLEARQGWDAVATAWDEFVDIGDEPNTAATQRMLDLLTVRAGERVLELAAGPGALAPLWSVLVGPDGSVLVSDVAEGMMQAAGRRCSSLPNAEVALLDAARIDRPDSSFDVVASRMGLMFVPEPANAFAEMHRVLTDGGRVGALTWGGLADNPWMTCVGMAAMMNGLVAGGPPIGPGGIFSLGDPSTLRNLAEEQGFHDIVVEEHPIAFHADSIDAHVARVSALAGPLSVAIDRASPDQLAGLRATAADLAAPYVVDDGVVLPGLALLLVAQR